ncbi:MAG: DUF4062 domain-containing protein [Anaerolineae bacterium]|nr:DUF4062 domain-containing protein [Anaerolineae bacterium]
MSHKERLDVFVSSTSYDLPEHRKAIVDALLSLNLQPRGMEYWAVTGDDPVQLCKRQVSEADAFIGIYAHRYGWCPVDFGGKSITELEYDWAGSVSYNGKSIPRFCFVIDALHPITIDMVEQDKKTELEAFKKRISAEHQIGFFKSVNDLKAQVIHALAEWSNDRRKAEKKAADATKQGQTSGTNKSREPKYFQLKAKKIDTGSALIDIIMGSDAHQTTHDDLQNDAEVELVGGFLQNITDYSDIWNDIDPINRTRAQLELQREIEDLASNGFLVYGCQNREIHRYGIGDNTQTISLNVQYIFVLRQSNPRVLRNSQIEAAMGFESQAFLGAFAPFLIYLKEY